MKKKMMMMACASSFVFFCRMRLEEEERGGQKVEKRAEKIPFFLSFFPLSFFGLDCSSLQMQCQE